MLSDYQLLRKIVVLFPLKPVASHFKIETRISKLESHPVHFRLTKHTSPTFFHPSHFQYSSQKGRASLSSFFSTASTEWERSFITSIFLCFHYTYLPHDEASTHWRVCTPATWHKRGATSFYHDRHLLFPTVTRRPVA